MKIDTPYPLVEFSLSIGTWDTVDFAYPDTGYDGSLTIPIGVSMEVVASPHERILRLADGKLVEVNAWYATVGILDKQFDVEVVALGNEYLLGRQILDQLEICFVRGRELRITL